MEIISNGSLIAVTLNDLGSLVFGYEGKANERMIFFVDKKTRNHDIGGDILFGQFLYQFEKSPKDTLNNGNRHPSRINYPHDSRVISYDSITPDEFDDFFKKMNQISQNNSAYSERINKIFNLISFQKEKVSA